MTYINKNVRHWNANSFSPQQSGPPEPEYPMRGLGDLVERVTTKTGIKAVVDKVAKVTGKDCGCGKRRDKLNQLVPFKKEDGNG